MTPAAETAVKAMRQGIVELEDAHKKGRCSGRADCPTETAIWSLYEAISGLEREDHEATEGQGHGRSEMTPSIQALVKSAKTLADVAEKIHPASICLYPGNCPTHAAICEIRQRIFEVENKDRIPTAREITSKLSGCLIQSPTPNSELPTVREMRGIYNR